MGPQKFSRRVPLGILLFSGFLDYAGIAIVYPLLAFILFDPSFHFLAAEASDSMRGLWLGILISLHPLCQFFFSPIFGSLSDRKGRKKLLILSFWISLLGYLFAILGIQFENLTLLALYRIFTGMACGNCSIVSAIVADISSPEKKAKHYGLLNMSFGAGFTLGPFLSGTLTEFYSAVTPFLVAFALVTLNLILVWWKLDETHHVSLPGRVKIFTALYQIKQAIQMYELRFVFLALLIFSFGWSFFTEFIPLFLINRYDFNPAKIGLYYGYTGLFYSLSAGFIIYPIIRKIGIFRILFLSMFFSGIYLLLFLWIDNAKLLWVYLPFSQFFLAFAYPAMAAVISNRSSDEKQGEMMGIYQSLIALALTLTPFFSGGVIGAHPSLTIIIGGVLMSLAAIIILLQRETSVLDAN